MSTIAALEVLSPGPLTSIQDVGRFGFGHYGVAPGGAVDLYALRMANLLAGNSEDQAAIEVTLTGFSAGILTDLVAAVTGADLQPCRNKQPLGMWCAQALKSGDILSFRSARSGCRAYVSLGGTIDIPLVMGSSSTNLSAGFGGFNGRALKKGDILFLKKNDFENGTGSKTIPPEMVPCYPRQWTLRVLWGPQDDHFPETACKLFLTSTFKAAAHSNRFGIRLEGPVIRPKAGMQESIISEGVIAGAIQVPGDGQPIIILGETVTGGYRKIATVISADLPLLGQIKPGNRLAFQAVSPEEALDALRDMEKTIQDFLSFQA